MDLNVGGSSPLTHPERKSRAECKLSVPSDGRKCGLKPLECAEVFRRKGSPHAPRMRPADHVGRDSCAKGSSPLIGVDQQADRLTLFSGVLVYPAGTCPTGDSLA